MRVIKREQQYDNIEPMEMKKDKIGPCEVYLLYFDDEFGHMPLLSCPDDSLIEDQDKMRLIKIHSIWFLDIRNDQDLDRIDLEYGKKMYFAKKFIVKSSRVKKRAGTEDEDFETIVLILSLPTELDIFGGSLLKKMAEIISSDFNNTLSYIIESELAKRELIKNQKLLEVIESGNLIKERLKKVIQKTCDNHFMSVIKKTDPTSLKIQKATSFLALKGIDFSHLIIGEAMKGFSNIRLFDIAKKSEHTLEMKKSFKILSVNTIKDTHEVEILIKNVSAEKLEDIRVKITYLEDFFEKILFSERIETWMPEEELIFLFPSIEPTKEYLIQIIQEHYREKLFSRKFELNNLH